MERHLQRRHVCVSELQREKGSSIAFFDIAATKPGKYIKSLIINIQGLRNTDQGLLTELKTKKIKDISLATGDSINDTSDRLESHIDAEIDSSPSKRSMAINADTMTAFSRGYLPLIGTNHLVCSEDFLF